MNRPTRVALAVILSAAALLLVGRAATNATTIQPGDDAPKANGLIATCDVFAVVDALLQSDRYAPQLETKREELSARLTPIEERLRALQGELQAADPENAETQAKFGEFQQLVQQYQGMGQQLEQEFLDFRGRLAVEAYDLARNSADAIAETRGYAYLINGRSPDKRIESTDMQQLLQAILGRPMLRQPEGTDLTDDVFSDLNLELP